MASGDGTHPIRSDTAATPLLIRFGRIGDMVLQIPLLSLLHRRYRRPCRLLTSGSWSQSLFAGNADVGELWQLRGRHTPLLLSPERWRIALRLRAHRGPVYVSEDSQRQLPKVRNLLAVARVAAERCVFLDQLPPVRGEHWIEQLLRLGSATPPAFAGRAAPPPDAMPTAARIEVTADDRSDRDAWLRERGFLGRPLVLLQPLSRHAVRGGRLRGADPKLWPLSRWAELVRVIAADVPDATLLLCGAPAERPVLERLRTLAAPARVATACADLPLRRLMAVLETAACFVSLDTGPAHIAAAVGCPLVVLYGSESPQRWGRRSAADRPVVELGGRPFFDAAEQIPLDAVVAAWRGVAGIAS